MLGVLGAIVGGIAVEAWAWPWFGALLALALLLFGAGCFTWNRRPAHPLAIALMLPLLGLTASGYAHLRTPQPDALFGLLPLPGAVLTGRVVSDPQAGQAGYRFEVQADSLDGRPLSAKLLVRSPRAPLNGERLLLEGRVYAPSARRNPGDFDYRQYLARRGVFSQMEVSRLKVLGKAPYQPIEMLRVRWGLVFLQVLPPERANLAASLVYGARTAPVDAQIERDFRHLGLSHMLAASGYQVGLILWVAAFLRNRWAIGLTAALLGVYVALTGAPPSILRAALVGGFALLAMVIRRGTHPLRAFGAGMGLLLLWDPLMLWDVGFQLSLVATFALLHTLPMVRPPWLRFLALPVVVQLWVMPIQLFHFGAIPWLAVPANWLGSIGVSGVTLMGFACGLLGLIWAPLAIAPLMLLDVVLDYAVRGVAWAAALPGIVTHLPPFSVALLGLSYAMVWGVVTRRAVLGWGAAAAAVWCLVLLPRPLEVTFLAVGQGDAMHVKTPGGRHLLIDGGPPGDRLLRYLERQGIRLVDLVMVSHPQADHLGGLKPLLGEVAIGQVWEGGFAYPSELYRTWLAGLVQKHVPLVVARKGLTWEVEPGVTLRVLAPDGGMSDWDTNDQSLVVWLKHGDVDLLLTGDVEAGAEARLLAAGLPDVDVLKVAHHGSRTSTSAAFLRAVRPEAAIIQVAERSRFGHPHPEALIRLSASGARVFRSDRGAVKLISDGRIYRIDGDD